MKTRDIHVLAAPSDAAGCICPEDQCDRDQYTCTAGCSYCGTAPAISPYGAKSAQRLLLAVSVRWFNAAPRVELWLDTLARAYTAVYAGDLHRPIPLPDGVTSPDPSSDESGTHDDAISILEAFDGWLGREVVYWAGGGCPECHRFDLTLDEIGYGHDCEVD